MPISSHFGANGYYATRMPLHQPRQQDANPILIPDRNALTCIIQVQIVRGIHTLQLLSHAWCHILIKGQQRVCHLSLTVCKLPGKMALFIVPLPQKISDLCVCSCHLNLYNRGIRRQRLRRPMCSCGDWGSYASGWIQDLVAATGSEKKHSHQTE